MSRRGGFDGRGHLTIDGRPRFVLGVYDSGGGYSTDPAKWERQIFDPAGDRGLDGFPLNVYLNYWLGAMPIGPTNALLDALHRRGVTYLQTGNCFEGGSWKRPLPSPFSIGTEAYVRAFAQHPAALGYYIADEPHDSLIPETVEHHHQLHLWDREGITLATLMAGYPNGQGNIRTDPRRWVDAADALAVDPYPLNAPPQGPPPTYPHFIVADYVSKLRAAVRPERPVWAVLQFFKGNGPTRLPTREEMRYHAVAAIVEGAQGLMWWDVGAGGIRREDTLTVTTYMGYLKELMTELAGLEPALLAEDVGHLLVNSTTYPDPVAGRIVQLQHDDVSDWLYSRKTWYREEMAALQAGDPSKSGGMLVAAASVRTRARVAEGKGYVFAYNYTNLPQPTRFTVPLSGISWADTFEPYGVRIYVLREVPGGIEVRENRTGQAFPLSGATLPPVVTPTLPPVTTPPVVSPPTAPPGASTAYFLGPAANSTVSGLTRVGVRSAVDWAAAKVVTLGVDGGPSIGMQSEAHGTTFWFDWNTRGTPNGARTLRATIVSGGAPAVAMLPVRVANS